MPSAPAEAPGGSVRATAGTSRVPVSEHGAGPVLAAVYAAKRAAYFEGCRRDFVERLPVDPTAKILEIGCGNGNTGALALSERKCGWYAGVEAQDAAAVEARGKLSEVVVGDVEHLMLPWPQMHFDALFMSEVLEHLVDPWAVLRTLHGLLKPGALVLCSSPNVSHHRVLRMLWNGEFTLADSGPMDRAHLRWFTPKSYAAMFASTGYRVEAVGPIKPLSFSKRIKAALLGGRQHLFMVQIQIVARRI